MCGPTCQDECLVFHNKYRLNHNVSTLRYDHDLATQAQQWADIGKLDSSSWAKSGLGGECWAWGNIFPSWKAVIKTWHDQEKNYDWKTFKSMNDQKVGCFQQLIWAGATKLGCGMSIINGLPFYVAQMDVAGVIDGDILNHAEENLRKPLLPDLHWFDGDADLIPGITKIPTSLKQF